MNVNKLIVDTLKPILPNNDPEIPLELNITSTKYMGKSTIYAEYNYADDRAIEYADNEPQIDVASMQIHLFCPRKYNYMTLKKQIRIALRKAGFTYPTVQPFYESDTDLNHIVFECEIEGLSEREEL